MTVTEDEGVYEVERIVGHTLVHHRKGYVVHYEIKWAGYGHEHNTVEAESDVYAPGRVLAYWKTIPDSNPEKQLFRKIQARRKNRINLPPSSGTQQRIPTPPRQQRKSTPQQPQRKTPPRQQRKSTPPEQQIKSTPLEATPPEATEEQRLLEELRIADEQRKSVEPPKEQRPPQQRKPRPRKPAAPKKSPQPKKSSKPQRLPQVIANEDDDEDESEDDYNELVVIPSAKRKPSDYFLEEHERKRKRETETVERRTSLLGDHIFAWDLEAVEVEYIGKESPDDTCLHCRVRWTDGKVTMHPLDEAREKRPDLVLDRFVLMAQENE